MNTFKQYLSEQRNQYDNTIIKLIDLYKNSFKHNEKTVQQLKDSLINIKNDTEKQLIEAKIKQEYNRIEAIITNAELIEYTSINEKLMNVIKIIANNGVDLDKSIAPNSEFRFKNIIKKINRYDLI